MTPTIAAAAAFCGLACLFHLTSVAVAIVRCRPRRRLRPPPGAPAVTVVRPVCGLDNFLEDTLGSSLRLDYPGYEVVFCVASAKDPAVPVVLDLIRRQRAVPARLLIGDECVSANPKLNNCVKGWNVAAHDWIVIADSNVLMPPDYIQRLLASWKADTGLVCAPPVGGHPDGFWAGLECAFLNTYQARAQYLADMIGLGFAQGKTMLWRRADLERAGGIRALGAEAAEDAAATKLVRAAGLRVRLVDAPFEQPLGRRGLAEVWRRQSRWARLRRASFPLFFLPEVLTDVLPPALATAWAADASELPVVPVVLTLLLVWYGAETALARAAHWHLSALYPVQGLLRDLLLPCLWVDALFGTEFVWRGNAMRVDERAVIDSQAV